MNPLDQFHPVIAGWFQDTLGTPTATQRAAWPHIVAGEHVLVSAPTGCGKTLTAFLAGINRFLQGDLAGGATRIVYVSPLKALNNDVQRNLLAPLAQLRTRLAADGATLAVRVATRSGDTDAAERQRLLRRPPEILITTPESLNLMLTTVRGRLALSSVDTVIMDEIHAIADNRRGVQLVTAVERIVELAGEVQRIALSATVRPLAAVAEFVGGYTGDAEGGRAAPRPVTIIDSADRKDIVLRVETPEASPTPAGSADARDRGLNFWSALGGQLAQRVQRQRSTLVFTNNRALAETLTLHVNNSVAAVEDANADEPVRAAAAEQPQRARHLLAYAHHGSLAREVRLDVEARLKAGELRAIIATSSLELGIDIGALDEVVMVQCPGSAASCLQRIGRAGHGVGETSHAAIIPTFAHDFLEAAAVAGAALERDIESIRLLEAPLDVLCQIIISMTGTEAWNTSHLLAVLRRSHPYRNLSRDTLALILDMLAGRYASTRIRALAARIAVDTSANELIEARKGALLALYSSGGTIPDRGYYKLRHAEHGNVMGELDEEFVWEARVGQVFTLGTRAWQVERITHDDVLARPAARASAPPFWRADALHRNAHLSQRLADLLESADTLLARNQSAELHTRLQQAHAFTPSAADALLDYLQAQRAATGTALPHRHHLLVEFIGSAPGGYDSPDGSQQIVLHTFWGGRVNRPYAIALQQAWSSQWDETPEIHATNDFIAIQTRLRPDPAALLALVNADNLDEQLRAGLADSEFFGVRFREAAGRALLLPKPRFGRRLPLWLARQKARELLRTTRRFADFPIVLEAWRTCLADVFELDALRVSLADLDSAAMQVSAIHSSRPSPFAANVAWTQITTNYMYADDTPLGADGNPDPTLLAGLMGEDTDLQVSAAVAADFSARRQRLHPGYAPTEALEIVETVRDLVLLSGADWQHLCTAVQRDAPDTATADQALADAAPSLARLTLGERSWVVARADADHVRATWCPAAGMTDLGGQQIEHARATSRRDERDSAALGAQWLTGRGPLTRAELALALPIPATQLDPLISTWLDAEALVSGTLLVDATDTYLCARESWEILLRMQRSATRAAHRQAIEVRPVTELPLYFAQFADLHSSADDALVNALERLRGYVCPAATLERDLLAARVADYRGDRLDAELALGSYQWIGAGNGRLTVIGSDEVDLVQRTHPDLLQEVFVDAGARYDFGTLADRQRGADTATFSASLWAAIWGGAVTTDDFGALRAGLQTGFELPAHTSADSAGASATRGNGSAGRMAVRRRARQRARGWPGVFRRVHALPTDSSALGRFEWRRERTRLLLDRYGVLCRDIVNRETPQFRWKDVFAALRTMEMAGEVSAGLFFTDLASPQFATPAALRLLGTRLDNTRLYWLACTDPLAPAGLVEGLQLPPRRSGNYLVLRGSTVIARIEADGRRLQFDLAPDDPDVLAMLWPLENLLYGPGVRRERISVEQINGAAAPGSPWANLLRRRFEVHHDHRRLELQRNFAPPAA